MRVNDKMRFRKILSKMGGALDRVHRIVLADERAHLQTQKKSESTPEASNPMIITLYFLPISLCFPHRGGTRVDSSVKVRRWFGVSGSFQLLRKKALISLVFAPTTCSNFNKRNLHCLKRCAGVVVITCQLKFFSYQQGED